MQRGLLTREQIRSLGMSRHELSTLLRNGSIVRVGHRTFALGGLPPDERRATLVACLDTGGVASHRTAAWLHGIEGCKRPATPEILVGRAGLASRPFPVVVHSTTWLPSDDLIEVDGIPCTSVARTLFALAGLVPDIPFGLVKGAIDDAVFRGRASDPWLWWRLEKLRRSGRNGVSTFERILVLRAGGEITESWLEREFIAVLVRAGVVLPVCQRRIKADGVFVARVDFAYEESAIVIEVTGAVGHSSPRQRAADARRRNNLGVQGQLVLEFTYEQVVGDPDAVVAAVLEALAARRRTVQPVAR